MTTASLGFMLPQVMDAEATIESAREPLSTAQLRLAPIAGVELRLLQQRSDARGLWRLFGHLACVAGAAALYALALARQAPLPLAGACALALGFTLVTLFATMHECVHRTAFESRWLNDSVAWFAGLLSFYNSTFYRPYHGWHHRFTQLPGQDPEMEDKKPSSVAGYFLEVSGLPWWVGKLRTYYKLATGRTASYGFLNEKNAPAVVRSVRGQLLVYGVGLTLLALRQPYFLVYWLLPVALAQPLLRAILLAEHMGCAESADMLSNTRTTYTLWPVRFLMWEMPYHAEHHRYPALPFFALRRAHTRLEPHLAFIARSGYVALNYRFLTGSRKRAAVIHQGTQAGG